MLESDISRNPDLASQSKIDQEIEPRSDKEQLIIDKLWTAHALAREYLDSLKQGHGKVVNQHLIGQFFFHSLFNPGPMKDPEFKDFFETHPEFEFKAEYLEEESAADSKLTKMMKAFCKPLPGLISYEFTDYEDFVDKFSQAMSSHKLPDKPEYASKTYEDIVYFPGAKEAVGEMLEDGPVRIWTAGDVYGLTIKNPDGSIRDVLPGSGEQLKRIDSANWAEFAQSAREKGQDFGVLAHENKFSLLPELVEEYRHQGVKKFVIVDDKPGNLDEAKKKLVESGVPEEDIILIWDRQGVGGAGSVGKLPKGYTEADIPQLEQKYNAVSSVTDIVKKARELSLGEKFGSFIDHDDVISETEQAMKIQEKNILTWLRSRGIISR